MADLSQAFFKMTLDSIASAYRAGRSALEARIRSVDIEAALHSAQVERGEAEDVSVDEETGQSFSRAEYFAYQSESALDMLNHHAQAFAVMVHHAWEKHVLSLNPGWTEYKCNKAYGELAKRGWTIDKARLERLRMVANFIKHESAEILSHHPEMIQPDAILPHKKRSAFLDGALRVTEDDMTDFLDAAYQSAGRVRANQKARSIALSAESV